jgi:hypothetical protein
MGAVERIDADSGAIPQWMGKLMRETVRTRLREQLPEQTLKTLLVEGQAMSLEEAASYAFEGS